MKPEDFDLFATLAKKRSGLVLTPDKVYLLESRLLNITRKYNMKSLADMAQTVRSRRDEDMMRDIADAIIASESSFFRDRRSFAQFRQFLVPRFTKARAATRKLRIWSAGTATGQEAYSLAMLCAGEEPALTGWEIEIVGTDISREMIERAASGTYNHFDVQRGLPIRMLVKYFRQIGPDKWQIKDGIRRMVTFRQGNLLQETASIGVFDMIFCRDVLGGFDPLTRTRLIGTIGKTLVPDGALVFGTSEPLQGIPNMFVPADRKPGIYVLSASMGRSGQVAVS